MQYTPDMIILDPLPQELRATVGNLWQQWCALHHDQPLPRTLLTDLPRVWAGSDYVAQLCLRYPVILSELHNRGDLLTDYPEGEYQRRLSPLLVGVSDDTQLKQRLREFRRREMLRIIWRDLTQRAALPVTLQELSALADACIQQALTKLYIWQCETYGIPNATEGAAQTLIVLGLGKLGGNELNVSSDVDLIFAYPQPGQTQGAGRQLDNHEFFLRLGQRLIQTLQQPTADGLVFRVDTRLRPFGESGPLAMSFEGMEHYYQTHGREWERYALIKARVVAGDRQQGAELLQILRPFVYRRYLDYNAYESLRELKTMIEKEVVRKGLDDNVKLGAGGIREIEFVAQVFQLIRGGRDKQLQNPQLFAVLDYIAQGQLLPAYVVDQLRQAYEFLRNTEHRLQAYADQQTHVLPTDNLGRVRLAFAMGFANWTAFYRALQVQRERVHNHFEQIFAAPQSAQTAPAPLGQGQGLWNNLGDQPNAVAHLQQLGFQQPALVYAHLQGLKTGRQFLSASARGQARLERLMPLLLNVALQQADPDTALLRGIHVIEAILQRTVYLALLEENPMALSQLIRLCAASPWISHYLAIHPILLDELLDPRNLYAPPARDALTTWLAQRLANVDAAEEEQQLDALRQFKHAQVLRVAAADIAGALPLMKVSDHLTWIAEAVLTHSLVLAWDGLVQKHGYPQDCGPEPPTMGFAIVAYGKLGGIELGYGSDLDLVFLYKESAGNSNGAKPVSPAVFYARLAQRLVRILTTLTPAGTLYDVDVRLRPEGAAGLLVSSVAAYADYQANKAWTWEHQALVRARVVAGDPALAAEFQRIRRQVLARARDSSLLRREVVEMRQKMRTGLDKPAPGQFDLKHSPGGIVDIEFMVQYSLLAWAYKYPELLTYSDNIRQLEGLAAAGVVTRAEADFLSEAYRFYRGREHRLKLQEHTARVDVSEAAPCSEGVRRIWAQWMEIG
ncbi:MAG: bifunctional [glutamate--ammonia ligase]-adenylyl-L-tyrosine phosphorylase/[glutamate--ammonia-ligase] adenylyltransferase [Gammaproteobacteria bacterium]|nr:bifunctional [glutamate--ammonia ligase]-adenylyl-L-tyrosine phosphorylase/[glutamate--ammonia-ligase] adenylyltransferase [Gammaproteobacteria bacterium]